MRLTLSSAAAPEARLDELLAACRRKGLGGVELVEGDAHGVGLGGEELSSAMQRARAAGVEVTGLRVAHPGSFEAMADAGAAEAPARPPLVVPLPEDGPAREALLRTADTAARNGTSVALASGDTDRLVEVVRGTRVPCVAWDFTPGRSEPGELHELVRAAGPRLTHVRLFGGGPESPGQEGGGIGALIAGLAVSDFPGALVITPTSHRYRIAWSTWLGRRGGWGCSGKATATEPIALHLGGA